MHFLLVRTFSYLLTKPLSQTKNTNNNSIIANRQAVMFKYHQWQKLEKEMATHYSILALKVSWIYEPGGL